MTNLEKIQKMNAEEMAEEIVYYLKKTVAPFVCECEICKAFDYCTDDVSCKGAHIKVLESEVEE